MTVLPELFPLEDLVPTPFPSVLWASRRLNKGVIPGTKIGRKWFMTSQDLAQTLELLKENKSTQPGGPTAASARRRRAS